MGGGRVLASPDTNSPPGNQPSWLPRRRHMGCGMGVTGLELEFSSRVPSPAASVTQPPRPWAGLEAPQTDCLSAKTHPHQQRIWESSSRHGVSMSSACCGCASPGCSCEPPASLPRPLQAALLRWHGLTMSLYVNALVYSHICLLTVSRCAAASPDFACNNSTAPVLHVLQLLCIHSTGSGMCQRTQHDRSIAIHSMTGIKQWWNRYILPMHGSPSRACATHCAAMQLLLSSSASHACQQTCRCIPTGPALSKG